MWAGSNDGGDPARLWLAVVSTVAVQLAALSANVAFNAAPAVAAMVPSWARTAARFAHTVGVAYYGPNVASVSIYLVATPAASSGERVVGVIGLVTAMGAFAAVVAAVGPLHSSAAVSLTSCHEPLLDGIREPVGVGGAVRRSYAVIDLAAALVAAMAAGFPYPSRSGCISGSVVLLIAAVAQVAVLLWSRPFTSRLDLASAVCLVSGNVAMAATCAAVSLNEGPGSATAVDLVVYIVTAITYGDLALTVVFAIW